MLTTCDSQLAVLMLHINIKTNPNTNPNPTLMLTVPYLTLPYHTGNTFYRLVLRPLTGPMRIPELTVRLQNPQVSAQL